MAKVAHGYAGVVRDDVRVDGLNGFRIRLDPADFVAAEMSDVTRQDGLSAQRHRLVGQRPLEFRQIAAVRHCLNVRQCVRRVNCWYIVGTRSRMKAN